MIDGKEMKAYLERCWKEMPAAQHHSKAQWNLWMQNDMVKKLQSKAGGKIRAKKIRGKK